MYKIYGQVVRHRQLGISQGILDREVSFHVILYVADGDTGTGLTGEQHTQGESL